MEICRYKHRYWLRIRASRHTNSCELPMAASHSFSIDGKHIYFLNQISVNCNCKFYNSFWRNLNIGIITHRGASSISFRIHFMEIESANRIEWATQPLTSRLYWMDIAVAFWLTIANESAEVMPTLKIWTWHSGEEFIERKKDNVRNRNDKIPLCHLSVVARSTTPCIRNNNNINREFITDAETKEMWELVFHLWATCAGDNI